jgi:hypothetical protein
MKKFLVQVCSQKYVTWEVEANNKMEALEIASNMDESNCLDCDEYDHEWTVKQIKQ